MLKNSASVAHIFVQDTATGLGVPSLTAAGSFTSIKLCQDGALGDDIKATLTGWADLGNGHYAFVLTAAMTNFGAILPVAIPSTATYQAYGVCIYTETAARAGDAMELVDILKHKAGATGYDRTTDSLEAIGDKVQNLPASPATEGNVTAVGNAVVDVGEAVAAVNETVAAVGEAVVAVSELINDLNNFDPATEKVSIADNGLSAAAVSTAALDKFCKIRGTKREISADGLQIKLYTTSGVLFCTLNRSAGAPYVWTPTWA